MQRIIRLGLLIGLLSAALGALGQDITAKLNLGRRDPKPDFYEYSPTDGGLVTFGPTSRISSRYLGLVKYDAQLSEAWRAQVLEQNGNRNIDFVTVIGRYILVFMSEFFPREKVIKTFYYSYDLAGNQVADQALLSVYPNQREQKVDLQYVLSPDKRRLLCYKNLQNRQEAENILYYIFDDEGDLVRNGEIGIRYPDDRFNITSLRISNASNVYLLGRFFVGNRIRNPDDFRYLIYKYEVEREAGFEIPVNIGARYISNLAFRLDREENIYLAGFYSNQREDQLAGTLFQKISPQGDLLVESAQPFTPNFLSNYLSSGQINRGRELRYFRMNPEDGIVLRSDGGVLLLAERFYVTRQTRPDYYSGMMIERQIYHAEDVVLTSIDYNGQVEWQAIVDKVQQSEQPSRISYFSAIGPGGIYIFYEDKPRGQPYNVYYARVGIDGSIERPRPLFRNYRNGDEFYPNYCEQISNDEAIMVYVRNSGRGLSVVKIKL
jgi:hypothetical protein